MFIIKSKPMKNLKKLFILAFCTSLCFACSFGEKKRVNKTPEMVTETFKVDFLGEYMSVIEGAESECDSPYYCGIVVDFKGTGTHLEEFAGTFEFCACGPDGEYAPTKSYMVSADGDTLIVSCAGKVVGGKLPDHPEYVNSYWKDPFIILGGTGRFEGATGSGMTDDYNSNEDANSHHHWEGTITMKKE